MKQDRISGIALIVGSLGLITTMAAHPTGSQIMADPKGAEHVLAISVFVHSLAIASLPVLVFGFLGFSQRLGFNNPLVSFSFINYAFACIAAMCAAVVNGFVVTYLFREFFEADEATRVTMRLLFDYSHWLNATFTKIFIAASSVAVLLWSIALIKKSLLAKIAAVIGIILGIVGIAMIIIGVGINVHSFGLFIFGQAAWTILIGVLMISSDRFLSIDKSTPQKESF